ncbi:hypothetical protein ACS0TY_030866 [Phlomoides rotata]
MGMPHNKNAGEVSVEAPLLSRIALQLGDDIRTWHGAPCIDLLSTQQNGEALLVLIWYQLNRTVELLVLIWYQRNGIEHSGPSVYGMGSLRTLPLERYDRNFV